MLYVIISNIRLRINPSDEIHKIYNSITRDRYRQIYDRISLQNDIVICRISSLYTNKITTDEIEKTKQIHCYKSLYMDIHCIRHRYKQI